MKVKTYHILDSNEFDALVKQVYDVQYEFVAAEEAHNYTSVTFNNMERGAEIDSYDTSKLIRLKQGEWVPFMSQTLIQDMVNNKVLDPGNYMIEVFW